MASDQTEEGSPSPSPSEQDTAAEGGREEREALSSFASGEGTVAEGSDEVSEPSLENGRSFKVVQLGSASQDITYQLFITPEALCFGRIGDAYSSGNLGRSYDDIDPLAPDFIDIDTANYRLPTGEIRILLNRRPHMHNPLNAGSMQIWMGDESFTYLLDYTTDVDQLIEALRPLSTTLSVQEDPALQILSDENKLHIILQWQRGTGLLLLAFALCWSLLTAYILWVVRSNLVLHPLALVLLVLFLLAGFFLLYYALTHIYNTTQIVLEGRQVRITHGPLPWITGQRSLSIPLDAEIRIRPRRLEQWSEYPTLTTYVYDLLIATPDTAPPSRLISLSRLPHALRVRTALQAALNY